MVVKSSTAVHWASPGGPATRTTPRSAPHAAARRGRAAACRQV